MAESSKKRKDPFFFLAVDQKYTNTAEGNRAIKIFNIIAFGFFLFYIFTAIPFFFTDAFMVGATMIIESFLFTVCIALTKKGYFKSAKNIIAIGFMAGVLTMGGVMGSEGFAHILFFPFVISMFIIFNRHEIAFRNFYIIIALVQFFIMEFSPVHYYKGPPLDPGSERVLEFWIFAISFIASASAVFYFMQLNYEYRNRIKKYLRQTESMNKELSQQSEQISESLMKLSDLNKKLETNEKRFRFISENSKDILALIDRSCTIQYVSPSIMELLGYGQGEVTGTRIDQYISGKDLHKKQTILANGKGEIRLRNKNGQRLWFEIVIVEIEEEDFSGYQVSVRDISDRKKVELELESNRSLVERIAETTPNFLYVFHHKEKRINYLNRSIWEYLGYDMNTLFRMEQNEFHLIHPEDKRLLERNYKTLCNSPVGKVISSEYRMKNAEGKWIWFESRDTVLEKTPDNDELILSLGEARDITENKENEAFLLKKQDELLSFVQAAPAAIAMVDTEMRYIAASSRWYEDYMLNEDIIGKTHYEIFPNLPEEWKEIHQKCLKGASMKEEEDVFTMENGERMWLRWEVIPWYRKQNDIGGIIMLTENITERKREKEELKAAKLEAERASEAKAQFLSTMSHEIRTPLNSVIGMTNLLLDDEPKPEQIENLKALSFGAENLMALINDILDFSKIEAGRIKFESTVFNLNDLLKNVVESFRVLVKEKRLELILEKGDQLPDYIKGDPTRLSQILNNLMSNAVKFTHEGHVKLIARGSEIRNQRSRLYFEVEDTGIGIPKEKQDVIFESFSQASSATTRKYGGTGLGLSITKKLVDLQDGKISLESVPGKGTSFKIELEYEVELKPQSEEKQVSDEKTDLSDYFLLLVEDNKMNQLVAKKFLSKWGIHFDIAENGLEAMQKVEEKDYDLILMDLHMPEMDGYEATERIRKMPAGKREVPIVALSASASPSVKEKMKELGMDGFVAKPFSPKDLFNTIRDKAARKLAD
jgi:PAS domain S-box-containing protein